jgi:hypothetical protein
MSRYKRVPLDVLEIDDRYQRPLNKGRVAKMVKEFDERRFGVLEVSQRNGHASVFDGQHRLEVARALGMKDVPCLVHGNLTPEEEAELFVALQRERRGVSQIDRFRARVFMSESTAVAINEIVTEAKFRIRRDGADAGHLYSIQAITSLEHVYERGNLPETLALLRELWGGDTKSTDGGLIEGLSILLEGYGHRLDDATMARLRGTPPLVILRRAIGHSGGGRSKGQMVAAEIRKVAGLRGAPRRKTTEAQAA